MRMFHLKKMLSRLLRSGFAVFGLVSICFIIVPAFPVFAADSKAAAVPTGPATVTPKLNVDIPGVNLATGQVAETGKILYESYLGTYIAGVYKYALSITVIAAALMMIYGGFKYILSSSMEGIKDGKENMANAVIGLVLVFGSYTLLAMLNPALLTFKPLELPIIEPVIYSVPEGVYQRLQEIASVEGCTASPAIKSAVAAAAGGTKPTRVRPNNPFDPRMTLPIDELNKMLDKIAKDAGVEPCILRAISLTESGGKQNSIGHDEDKNGVQYQSRLDFLRSGVTFLKKNFIPPKLPEECTEVACKPILDVNIKTVNDDDLTATPPDYGLDWRFSHGLGYGQFTLYPRTSRMSCTGKDGSNGRKIGDVCFTVPCVMTWEGQTEATVKLLAAIIKTVDKTNACQIFEMYSGEHGDKTCTGRLAGKMKAYTSCKDSKK